MKQLNALINHPELTEKYILIYQSKLDDLEHQKACCEIEDYTIKFNEKWLAWISFYQSITPRISKKFQKRFKNRYYKLLFKGKLEVDITPKLKIRYMKIEFVRSESHEKNFLEALK